MLNIIKKIFNKTAPKNNFSNKKTVYNHTKRNPDRTFKGLSPDEMQEIEDHIKKYIGPFDQVMHEVISDGLHLDLIIIPARKKFPFNTIVTLGASEYAMKLPKGYNASPFAEYMIFLPENWPIDIDSWNNEALYWPIRMLKMITRIPKDFNTWFGYGHTIPNGNPPESFHSSTNMKGALITYPYPVKDPQVWEMTGKNKKVNFWCIAPIYKEEWEFKLKNSTEKLEDTADKKRIDMTVINPERESAI